jgi:hypothetical protein
MRVDAGLLLPRLAALKGRQWRGREMDALGGNRRRKAAGELGA